MTSKDALTYMLGSTKHIVGLTLSDLDDADLQVRPVPGANNIAWQLGHLIASETMLGAALGIKYPELPPIILSLGNTETTKTQPDGGNLPKAEYLRLFNQIRDTTIAGLAQVPDADLDKPTEGRMKEIAPRAGDVIGLIANHTMMHCGQFSVVRRLLNKPVAI